MNAELKAKWVAALRSGDYKQTTGVLRLGDAFCCLGVLCEVAGVPAVEGGYRFSDGFVNFCILSGSMAKEVGQQSASVLVDLNDNGKPFTDIADWIEANVEAQ